MGRSLASIRSGTHGDIVLGIGPGKGVSHAALALAASGARVVAIERRSACLHLSEIL